MDEAAPPRVDDEVLEDLRARLRAWRRVPTTGVAGWERGTEQEWLVGLVDYWAEEYDWRRHEERIRALPWEYAGSLRVVHQRAADPDATAVLLLHGWPDSVLRFERVLPLLGDVQLVAPPLPGYPFQVPLDERNLSSAEMAEPVAEAMAELGYERYVVSAGDIGRGVAVALASRHSEHVAALHVTDMPLNSAVLTEDAVTTEEERAYFTSIDDWRRTDGAYLHQQATRPHTLAVGLGDSPAGLAAWIAEKLRGWSDCEGDVESVFPRDDLLTWITAYWGTGTIGTSFAPYAKPSPAPGRIEVPTVVSQFPHELLHAPRSMAEKILDVRVWQEPTVGGHFAAWEQPEQYVEGVRSAVALAEERPPGR
jgi:pimeloyl-ACP methyl ester carboxylesterase